MVKAFFNATPPPSWPRPDPRLENTNWNYRIMLRGVPPVFLAYWIPPSGPESQCIIQIGDFIKVDGDPRTFKVMDTVSTSQVGGPNQSMDFIVEIVTYQVPESDPNYATEYEILNKIF